jgi:membrane protein implicated in regulation of membrane protease activity
MDDAWIWGAVGAVLVIVEIALPGYFLIFPALAALIVAGAALALHFGVEAQLGLFAAAAIVMFGLALPHYRRLTARGKPSLVNSPDRLIGALATVEDPIIAGRGKIRLGDAVWLARGPELERGRAVRVTAVAGTVLSVEPTD